MATEGCGSCNGVNYTYTVANHLWFGHCKCKIHRYFLEAEPRRLNTDELFVAGRKWRLEFAHTKGGCLEARLILLSKSSVKVQYSISVLNSADPTKDIDNCGGSILYHPGTAAGNSEVCSIAEIKDRRNGFLSDDIFTVYLKIRQKIPENEDFKLQSSSRSVTATWKLRHVHQLSPTELVSDDFKIGDSNWYLSIHPGDRLGNRKYVGIHLHSLNEFPIQIAVRLTIINHKSKRKNISSDLVRVYDRPSGYGWSQVLETKALRDPSLGFLQKGWVTITAEITQQEVSTYTPEPRNQRGQSVVCF